MTDTDGEMEDPIIGIDLGTTNSLVAFCDEAGPRVLTDEGGEAILPSVVRFAPGSTEAEAVGTPARDHAVEHPHRTIFSAKRLMGRGMADVVSEQDYLPYELVAGDHDTARVAIPADGDGEPAVVSPQQVSAIILKRLRARAEAALNQTVRRAVITVPAYFDDAQRQATRDAGRIAGLEVMRIVNEPTAAALAYNIGLSPASSSVAEKNEGGEVSLNTKVNPEACTEEVVDDDSAADGGAGTETVAVYDLGGGTFDVSILKIARTDSGVVDQVLATAGDTHLGGDDVDRMIVEHLQGLIAEQRGQTTDFPAHTRQAFRSLAEAAKIRLSDRDEATIEIDLPGEGDNESTSFTATLTRDQLEAMARPWVKRTLDCSREALAAADLDPADVDRVILVGGSTRMPLVQAQVADFFEADPYRALDPDRVVALGAAVQGAILAGRHQQTLLLDVIPLSLGIETAGGAVAKLITANTTIPARATEMFSTGVEGQRNVKIHVLQGERELVKDCRSLGQFELRGIPPMPAGLPKIEVAFLVDANGILNVTAIEKRSEKAASIQVVPSHGLTRDEVAQMEADSLEHAVEDMTAHRVIDLKNQARMDLKAIDRQLEKAGDQIDADTRSDIEQRADKVRDMLEADQPDADAFHEALDAMDQASVPLAEAAIAQTLKADQAAEGAGG
ncbi:MAG: Hsp70 family protein [Phycisphaeraceae bacterium]|nr:Hsp70 family protein [Phycisphaeraceae bacterium]